MEIGYGVVTKISYIVHRKILPNNVLHDSFT